jgi:predicted Zn-dependent protease
MKHVLVVLSCLAVSAPAHAQLGSILDKAKKIQDEKAKVDQLNVSEAEERKIGDDVSAKIRERFGVVQDVAVHKYAAKVGMLLAQQSERPALDWTFIVLDTDGVNAFASPGGVVHITRGALGLIKNEAELAGVLGHEIGHVAHKHAVNAIRKGKAVQMGADAALKNRGPYLDEIANQAYKMILENAFDRGDELDADAESARLTQKVGYASSALADFLSRLDERNKDQPARNGLFASHPETKERIEKIRQSAGSKGGAIVEARYKQNIKYEATPVTAIATVEGGSSGLMASSSSKASDKSADADKAKKDDDKKDENPPPKKKGFGIGNLTQTVAPERGSAQVSASGGARGLGPDRAAKGGGNPSVVKVTVTATELAEFKKGIT